MKEYPRRELSPLDARCCARRTRGTSARPRRSASWLRADMALPALRRLRYARLVEDDGQRPPQSLRTDDGDGAVRAVA